MFWGGKAVTGLYWWKLKGLVMAESMFCLYYIVGMQS